MHTLEQLHEYVNQLFDTDKFTGEPHDLFDPVAYTMQQGGKRLRPTLLLAATEMFGGNIDLSRSAALGIETFHNFTLLHDDLMDQSPTRRGKPTVYTKWNPNTAILSGDAMTAIAWQFMLQIDNINKNRILHTFNGMCMDIYRGQQYDMDFETRQDVTIGEYMEMINLKTAALISNALKIGALHTDTKEENIDGISRFGTAIGLAFQLRDDLLDAYGDESKLGKATWSDIRDNKKTYLFLLATQKADPCTSAQLKDLFSTKPDDCSEKIRTVLNIYDRLSIKAEVENKIDEYQTEAQQILDSIETNESNKATIRRIASSLVDRQI